MGGDNIFSSFFKEIVVPVISEYVVTPYSEGNPRGKVSQLTGDADLIRGESKEMGD